MAAGAAGGEADEQNCTEIGQEFLANESAEFLRA